MRLYPPSEVANTLQIKTSTLRKYSLLLEKEGYKFKTDGNKKRFYSDTDVIVLRRLMDSKNNNAMTLEEAVKGVVSWYKGEYVAIGLTDEKPSQESDTTLNKDDINELKEIMYKQTEAFEHIVGRLIEKIDHQQQTIDNLHKRLEVPEEPKGLLQRIFKK